jgi:hypothetical protein
MRKLSFLVALGFLLLAAISCMPGWTTAIRYGKTIDGPFIDTVKTEVVNGLHIVPVEIEGRTYRFLFDTGATFSISEKVQQRMNYKTVSKGSLIDSDNNRQQVNYVQVDSIFIGHTPFTAQTAFVADFTANPVINCLEIDGIIGSNLMRFCQWKIDYQNTEIILFNDTVLETSENGISLPFALNKQFDQIIKLKLNKATLNNLKIDYGSNGSLTISKSAMNVLKENDIVKETYAEKGSVSSGLYGKASISTREFAWADTLQYANFMVEGVELKTGKSGLIGGEILSRFVVTINFKEKEIWFDPVKNAAPDYSTFGFSLGYSDEKQFYIKAIIKGSPADELGLSPGTRIIRINDLDFANGSSFCDYASYITAYKEETLELVYTNENEQTNSIVIQKRFIY